MRDLMRWRQPYTIKWNLDRDKTCKVCGKTALLKHIDEVTGKVTYKHEIRTRAPGSNSIRRQTVYHEVG